VQGFLGDGTIIFNGKIGFILEKKIRQTKFQQV
jgi:hypothetical protein